MTENEYQKLVQYISTVRFRIPRFLIANYYDPECRSMLGRYLARSEKDYANAARVLETVVGKPISRWSEEDCWCEYDYAVCLYNLDGNEVAALNRIEPVYQWATHNSESLQFLSLPELHEACETLQAIRCHQKRREG